MLLAFTLLLGVTACGTDSSDSGLSGSGSTLVNPTVEPGTSTSQDPAGPVASQPSSTPKNPATPGQEKPVASSQSPVVETDVAPFWFDDDLLDFLENEKGWSEESYMASPTSFRAALCLAIEGASGETREALMQAARFTNDIHMQNWYTELQQRQQVFLERYNALKENSLLWGDRSDPGMGFDLANGVWDNASKLGGFRPEYIKAISEKYGATASASDKDKITGDVNNWCSEKTHGMINSISEDLSDASAVLVNALYVKSAWRETFEDYATAVGSFTTIKGDSIDLEYMNQTEDFPYYEDTSGRKYAMFELEGDIWLTVCLDTNVRVQDFYSAMYNARYEKLGVKMPKLDLETSLSKGELTDFLVHQGAEIALSDSANFTAMTDLPEGWHIDDIIQKTRIKTDEQGLEAAAVTAIMMADNAAIIEPVEPIPFYIDRPFSFLITAGRYTTDSDATILFFGQYTGV